MGETRRVRGSEDFVTGKGWVEGPATVHEIRLRPRFWKEGPVDRVEVEVKRGNSGEAVLKFTVHALANFWWAAAPSQDIVVAEGDRLILEGWDGVTSIRFRKGVADGNV